MCQEKKTTSQITKIRLGELATAPRKKSNSLRMQVSPKLAILRTRLMERCNQVLMATLLKTCLAI
jgi:hypothetical protein